MQEENKNRVRGIAGTVIFHLVLLIVILTVKLGDVKTKHQELLTIEFAEDNYKPIEQIIEERKAKADKIQQLDQKTLSNIASNTADKLNKDISTEKYIKEVMKELGMEEINPKYDNSLPDDPELAAEKNKKEEKEETSQNFGPTRIEYNLEDGRRHRRLDRPIYRCEGGGIVVVQIAIDQEGYVIDAKLVSSTSSDPCVTETALESAKKCVFKTSFNSPKKVNGTIKYIFVAQ